MIRLGDFGKNQVVAGIRIPDTSKSGLSINSEAVVLVSLASKGNSCLTKAGMTLGDHPRCSWKLEYPVEAFKLFMI
jgi:hypothetical protein